MRHEGRPSTVRHLGTAAVVTLPQEIDINNGARVCHELTRALADTTAVLIADMSLTEFCDSSGIRHLLIADKAAQMRGAELRLVVPAVGSSLQASSVLLVMRTLGVDKVFSIYDSMTAALSGPVTLTPQSPERRSVRRFWRA